jgi:hypothetical protein
MVIFLLEVNIVKSSKNINANDNNVAVNENKAIVANAANDNFSVIAQVEACA